MRKDPEFFDPDTAQQSYNVLVKQWYGFLLPFIEQFLEEVIQEGLREYGPSLTAAAKDPFAFTNVEKRWREAVRKIAESNSQPGRKRAVRADAIKNILANADMPRMAHTEVKKVLRKAVKEGWSKRKTQIELNRLLLPKQGDDETRMEYRRRVRSLAKRIAAGHHNDRVLEFLESSKTTHKMWLTQGDSRVRHTHRVLHGEVIPVDDLFQVGVAKLPYPGFPGGPPEEVINCRCLLIGATGATIKDKKEK